MKEDQKVRIVIVRGAVNTARRGTGVHRRIAAVMTSKTVAEALRRGARRSTISHCERNGLIRTK